MTEPLLKGVVLAAGLGTRMAALTKVVPKPMLPVANTPALGWILRAMQAAGVREAMIVTGYRAEAIEAYCGDGAAWGMALTCKRQTDVTGTGSATRLARAFAGGDPFMLTYGDILLARHEYRAAAALFFDRPCAAVSALNRMPDVSKGSAVYLDGTRITEVVEKPPPGTAGTNLNNAGVYVFTPAIFEAIDRTPVSSRGEYELTEAVQTLIRDGAPVLGHVIDGRQYDIGTPEAFLETNEEMMPSGAPPAAAPEVIADNFASPNVVRDEPVTIGGGCVLERCRLGPYACVGDRVRIGHGATIRHSVILPDADIGDGASLSYTVVGHGAGVGNRTVLHGAPDHVRVVGDG